MIAFVASIIRGTENRNVSYGVRAHTKAGIVFDVFSSLGTIAFAFAGHSVALEIQATIPSPSKKPMWRGVVVAYIIVAICYFCVSVGGFWAFGDQVDDDVLVTLEKPDWLIIIANFMVFIHVLGSYQVNIQYKLHLATDCKSSGFSINHILTLLCSGFCNCCIRQD